MFESNNLNFSRVLHISPGFTGGIATHINNIVRGVDSSKIKIDVAAFPADKHNAPSFILDIEEKGGKVFDLVSPKKNPIKFYKQINQILNSENKYELVHIHMHGVRFAIISLVCRTLGAKRIISHAHIADGKASNQLKNKIKHSIDIILTRLLASQYISCSKIASKYVFGSDVVQNNMVMHIPNSIDISKFNFNLSQEMSDYMRAELNIKRSSFIVGHIGYFGYQKNHKFMIKLIKYMVEANEDFVWLFIGIGEEMDDIKNLVKRYNLEANVRFLGFRKDIPELLKFMDIMLLPSIFEGLPTVAIESQASGTPCLLSKNVSDETDLEIGLCKFLSLDDNIDIWYKEIKEMLTLKATDEQIKLCFDNKCFTNQAAATLYQKFVNNEIFYYNLT